jgi:hypothetical protein
LPLDYNTREKTVAALSGWTVALSDGSKHFEFECAVVSPE